MAVTLTVEEHLVLLDTTGVDYTVAFSFDPEGLEITVEGMKYFYPEGT